MAETFYNTIPKKSDEELLEFVQNHQKYVKDAVDLAIVELKKRGKSIPKDEVEKINQNIDVRDGKNIEEVKPKKNWLSPFPLLITDIETAKKAARQGVYAIWFMLFITVIHLINYFRATNELNIPLAIYFCAFIMICWRMYRVSLGASVAGLILFVLERTISYSLFGIDKDSMLYLMFVVAFINSIRGAYAFQKYSRPQIAKVESEYSCSACGAEAVLSQNKCSQCGEIFE